MRFPFEAHQGNRIPFQSNIPGRTFRNPPHPENATHYSAKNRVAVSQALDATLVQGDRLPCTNLIPPTGS